MISYKQNYGNGGIGYLFVNLYNRFILDLMKCPLRPVLLFFPKLCGVLQPVGKKILIGIEVKHDPA